MGWWPWSDNNVVQAEIAQTYAMVTDIHKRVMTGAQDMSKVHDRVRDLVADLDKSADTVIANAVNSETEWQDVVTSLEAVIEKLKKKIEDDASQGSSTGGGSGAR
jgi:TATA-box binding protein (TBP) (component of TFIID and TFIIIB)